METRFVCVQLLKWTVHQGCFYQHCNGNKNIFWNRLIPFQKIKSYFKGMFWIGLHLGLQKTVGVTKWGLGIFLPAKHELKDTIWLADFFCQKWSQSTGLHNRVEYRVTWQCAVDLCYNNIYTYLFWILARVHILFFIQLTLRGCVAFSIIAVHAFPFRVASMPTARYDQWRSPNVPIVHYVSGIYGCLYIYDNFVNPMGHLMMFCWINFVWVWVNNVHWWWWWWLGVGGGGAQTSFHTSFSQHIWRFTIRCITAKKLVCLTQHFVYYIVLGK